MNGFILDPSTIVVSLVREVDSTYVQSSTAFDTVLRSAGDGGCGGCITAKHNEVHTFPQILTVLTSVTCS